MGNDAMYVSMYIIPLGNDFFLVNKPLNLPLENCIIK